MIPSRRRFLQRLAASATAAPVVQALIDAGSTCVRAAERIDANDPTKIRGAYTVGKGVGYLNHASIGTVPRAVQDAHHKYLTLCETNPWLHMWGGAWEPAREEVRTLAAARLHCDPAEVAITHNTTEGFNLLAQGLPLGSDDEVLFSSLNHAGASVCWNVQAPRRGFAVRSFPFPVERVLDLDEDTVVRLHVEQISSKTRVLCLPEIDNTVGLRLPVARIAKAARARGVRWIAVDGAQSLGMTPVDVRAMDADFFAASPHKWVQCPKGLGLLYARKAVQKDLIPMIVTWGQDQWGGSARAYEDYGTRNLPAVLALGDALRFQARFDAVRAPRYAALRTRCLEHVARYAKLSWRSAMTPGLYGSLHAIGIKGATAAAVAKKLFDDHGFVVRPFRTGGFEMLRVSPNLMNPDEEVDRFFATLGKLLG